MTSVCIITFFLKIVTWEWTLSGFIYNILVKPLQFKSYAFTESAFILTFILNSYFVHDISEHVCIHFYFQLIIMPATELAPHMILMVHENVFSQWCRCKNFWTVNFTVKTALILRMYERFVTVQSIKTLMCWKSPMKTKSGIFFH